MMQEQQKKRARLCVFAGSREGTNAAFRVAACELADELVRRQIGLIYGGARDGLMGILADRMLALGGEVIGVTTTGLWLPEEDHPGVTTMYRENTMAERKARMMSLADGFLVLPGGVGTMDELFEVLTLQLLKDPTVTSKPLCIWNVKGYYNRFRGLMKYAHSHEFLSQPYTGRMNKRCAPLLKYIMSHIDREGTSAAAQVEMAL